MSPIVSIRNNRSVKLIVFFFAIIYCSISIVNHLLFRTYALDLGLYTNAIYDYSHLQFNDSTVFNSTSQNLLADHFDLFLPLISFFSYIFGNYTLLIIQIVALLSGGVGVLFYLRLKDVDEKWARFGMIYFLLHFSVFSALSYDYHSNVIAASFVPWLFYFSEKKQKSRAWLFLFLILITKENMSLWMIFVCLSLWLLNRRTKDSKYLLAMSGVSLIWFVVVTSIIMPALSGDCNFIQFKYSILGSNFIAALITVFTKPFIVLKTLFVNHTTNVTGNYVKLESWIFFLFSGGLLLLFRPIWLLMLVPVFLQKFLHDQIQMWGINDQYSIEFAPILAMGIFSGGNISLPTSVRRVMLSLAILGCFICTIRLMDRTSSALRRANVRLYQPVHWKSEMNATAIHEALKTIPNDASVSAQTAILPHLAWRDNAFCFPMINDADFILYERGKDCYPISQQQFLAIADSLENNASWKVIFQKENVRLLERIKH